jgi:DNA-binding MarR family transcriptional regulator
MTGIEKEAARVRMVIRRVMRQADALRDKDSPTRSEQAVLAMLDEKDAMTPRALADAQQVRPQTMQQTLDSLGKRRWIRRADHPSDRRQILISLSVSGAKALEKGRLLRQAWLVGELGKLTRTERRTLDEALSILERFCSNPPTPK